jgi:glutamine synthetase
VVPDLPTARRLPWRPSSLQVIGDAVEIDRSAVRSAPRTVLRRVMDQLAAVGFTAQLCVEIDSFLVDHRPAAFGRRALLLAGEG